MFQIGTFPFFALIIVELLVLMMFIAFENGVAATVSMIIFVFILHVFGDTNLVAYTQFHPQQVLLTIAAYFAIGTGWGLFKWWLHVRDLANKYFYERDRWLRSKGVSVADGVPLPEELRKEWRSQYRGATTPRVSDSAPDILRWMTYWPVSVLWTLMSDVVTRLFRAIYNAIARSLQSIADRAFAAVKKDFE